MIIKICFLHTERTVCQLRLFTTELRNLYREFQNSKKSQNKFTVAIVGKLEVIIQAGRQVKIHNAADANGGLRGLPRNIMHNHPQFQNIGARWFPREPNLEHKMTIMVIAVEHLCQYKVAGEDMFNRIAIVQQSWTHHFQPTSKCTSMPCKHPRSLVISNQKV